MEDEFEEDFESTADEDEGADDNEEAVIAEEKRDLQVLILLNTYFLLSKFIKSQRKQAQKARKLDVFPVSTLRRPSRKLLGSEKPPRASTSKLSSRQSSRKSTIINSQELDTKLKDANVRRVSLSNIFYLK